MKIKGAESITFGPTTEGVEFKLIVLCCSAKIVDGELELTFGQHFDYHLYESCGRLGLVNRAVQDRDKYPNWPNPEPAS